MHGPCALHGSKGLTRIRQIGGQYFGSVAQREWATCYESHLLPGCQEFTNEFIADYTAGSEDCVHSMAKGLGADCAARTSLRNKTEKGPPIRFTRHPEKLRQHSIGI